MESLWKPPIQDPEDTTNFDFEIPCDPMPEEEQPYDDDDNGNQFYGFTFRRFLTNGGPHPHFSKGKTLQNHQANLLLVLLENKQLMLFMCD